LKALCAAVALAGTAMVLTTPAVANLTGTLFSA
jgi:hypothetical protein